MKFDQYTSNMQLLRYLLDIHMYKLLYIFIGLELGKPAMSP